MEKYLLKVAGLERELEKFPVNDNLDIAAFIMFGDVEMTERTAQELLKICPDHDVVVTAEAKGIPLCYEMARQGCRDYVIARKGLKVYMRNSVSSAVNSITTHGEQKLYLGESEINKLKNKRVLIVDDVVSTGNSLIAIENLLKQIDCEVVGKACVLAEGDAADRDDIIFLEKLPLFFNTNS